MVFQSKYKIITIKPEFLAATNFRQNTVREHSRLQFFASAQVVKKKFKQEQISHYYTYQK